MILSLSIPEPFATNQTQVGKTGFDILQRHRLHSRMDMIRDCDKVLEEKNKEMKLGEYLDGFSRLNAYHKYHYYRLGLYGRIGYFFAFLFHRLFPKLHPVTRKLYLAITKGKTQYFSKTEVLGRLFRAGFQMVAFSEEKGEIRFRVYKSAEFGETSPPSYWPVFRMRRVGKNGKIIHVYKWRTMHPYAEYVQEFIRVTQGLDETGKFKNDFRVTRWGKFLRKYWLDELPMLFNLFSGNIKLIGVRPISANYLKLYPESFQEYRKKFKPGLIPPYYADMPRNFDEIVASENRYFESYEKNAFMTDLRYFSRILSNILVKKARSK
ncbi:MAG: sugar transferase [Chitinophagaceae bacterium]|nr:sugar transferase [Chitinophagaceae bacterium]